MFKVLIISPNAGRCLQLISLLRSSGVDPVLSVAPDGAKEVVLMSRPQVLLVDMGVYETAGIDLIDALRRQTNERLPAVLLSCRDAAQRSYLQKTLRDGQVLEGAPLRAEKLMTAIQSLAFDSASPM